MSLENLTEAEFEEMKRRIQESGEEVQRKLAELEKANRFDPRILDQWITI